MFRWSLSKGNFPAEFGTRDDEVLLGVEPLGSGQVAQRSLGRSPGSCAPTDVWELELHAEVALDCGGEGGPDEGGQEGGQEGGD